MNEINQQPTAEEQSIKAHEYLLEFLSNFDKAKRGGIHDFMEMALYNMINKSVGQIDDYLKYGHKVVNPAEIITIFLDSCQVIIDGMKRNIEKAKGISPISNFFSSARSRVFIFKFR